MTSAECIPPGQLNREEIPIPQANYIAELSRACEATYQNEEDRIVLLDAITRLNFLNPFNAFTKDAALLCLEGHKDKRRKVSDLPYANHPFEVAIFLASFGITDDDITGAALLHDIIEDSPRDEHGRRIYTTQTLRNSLSIHDPSLIKRTINLVSATTAPELTLKEKQSMSWETRKKIALDKVLSHKDPRTRVLKAADLLANATNTLDDWYRPDEEGFELHERSFDGFSEKKEQIIKRFVNATEAFYMHAIGKSETNPLLHPLNNQVGKILREIGLDVGTKEWIGKLQLSKMEYDQMTQELGATP